MLERELWLITIPENFLIKRKKRKKKGEGENAWKTLSKWKITSSVTVSVGLFHVHVLWMFQQSVRLARRMGEQFMALPHLAQVCSGTLCEWGWPGPSLPRREKCHTSEMNQQGRANFDSYAKVIWIRQSFDDYKAGLDILVGADFPVICSFNDFFTLGRNEEKMAFWQIHMLDSELPRNAEN